MVDFMPADQTSSMHRPLIRRWGFQRVLIVAAAIAGMLTARLFLGGEFAVAILVGMLFQFTATYILERYFEDPMRADRIPTRAGWEETLLFVGSLIVFFLFAVFVMDFFTI